MREGITAAHSLLHRWSDKTHCSTELALSCADGLELPAQAIVNEKYGKAWGVLLLVQTGLDKVIGEAGAEPLRGES
jgi:hypothetical protein